MADATIHVLTQEEAVNALRITSAEDCPNLEMLLSSTDEELKSATGHDWAQDETIDPDAKTAAMLYLICLSEGLETSKTYSGKIIQLDAKVKGMESGEQTNGISANP